MAINLSNPVSGSPYTMPDTNVTALAYRQGAGPRIYYCTANDHSKIKAMQVNGTADTAIEITLNSANNATSNDVEGLTYDGQGNLYALVGELGSRAIHKYRISDRTYLGTHPLEFGASDDAVAIEAFPIGQSTFIGVVRNNTFVVYNTTFGRESTHDIALRGAGLPSSGNWDGVCYDEAVDRLLFLGEIAINQQDRSKLFGWTTGGNRDSSEDTLLPAAQNPNEVTFDQDNDNLYWAHQTSNQLHAYGDYPRWHVPGEGFDYTILQNQSYSQNIADLVDVGPGEIELRTPITGHLTGLEYDSATGNLVWPTPPAPLGGTAVETLNLEFRATAGVRTTDNTIQFQLTRTAAPPIRPQFRESGLPEVQLDEPYNPPSGQPNPSLQHNVQYHLTDYLEAGTNVTFTATAISSDIPGTFDITARYDGNTRIMDVFTFNASNVNASVAGLRISIGAANTAGHDSTNFNFAIQNLIFPNWHGSQTINISDTALHSINLRNFLESDPQADIALVGNPPTAFNHFSLNNGTLTIQAQTLPSQADEHYNFAVTATNKLTSNSGVTRSFNVVVQKQTIPNSIPVWQSNNINLRSDRGSDNRVDLRRYITSANPAPTFSIASDANDLGASISQSYFLQYNVPNQILVDTDYPLVINASNSEGDQSKDVTVTGIANTVPRVTTPFPEQSVHTGDEWRLNLADYITGVTPITYAFADDYTPRTGLTLSGSVLSWTPMAADFTRREAEEISVVATNSKGSIPILIRLTITVDSVPVWTETSIELEIVEGQSESFDLNPFVIATPPANIQLSTDYNSPANLSLSVINGTLNVTHEPHVNQDTNYEIRVMATNDAGSAFATVVLRVLASNQPPDTIQFSASDYNEIRYLLGPKITPDEIPDEVIRSTVYEGAAKDWVNRVLADAGELSIENLKAKKRATLYRCAALLCGKAPMLLSQTVGETEQEFGESEWMNRENSLNRKANEEITRIFNSAQGVVKYNLFAVAGG